MLDRGSSGGRVVSNQHQIICPNLTIPYTAWRILTFQFSLTMTYPIIPLHVDCYITLRLIAIFGKRYLTSYFNRLSENQEWSQYKLSWALNFALNTSALNTFSNRPRGSLKVFIRVLVLTSYLWREKKRVNWKLTSWAVTSVKTFNSITMFKWNFNLVHSLYCMSLPKTKPSRIRRTDIRFWSVLARYERWLSRTEKVANKQTRSSENTSKLTSENDSESTLFNFAHHGDRLNARFIWGHAVAA